MYRTFTALIGLTTAVMSSTIGSSALYGEVVIGGFENGMASGVGTAEWYADTGIRTLPQIIDSTSPYAAGITEGEHALKFTFPRQWAYVVDPFLRLDGGRDLVDLITQQAGFGVYMYYGISMDVTTFWEEDDPSSPENELMQPVWRQAFITWEYLAPYSAEYPEPTRIDRNDDTDAQQDFAVPWAPGFRTASVSLGLDDPSGVGAYNQGDDKVPIQFYAQEIADYEAEYGPIPDFEFNLKLVFQGDDLPAPSDPTDPSADVFVVIDNIHFTDGIDDGGFLPTDYNDDGSVDVLDYVYWRNVFDWIDDDLYTDNPPPLLYNEVVDIGICTENDFLAWKEYFGLTINDAPGLGAGPLTTAGVPEPSSILLTFIAAIALAALRRIA